MWEYLVEDIYTGDIFYIYGYDIIDACHHRKINVEDIDVLDEEYMSEYTEEDLYDDMFYPCFY